MVNDANAFLVVDTRQGAYGLGLTLEGAVLNLKRVTGLRGKTEVKVVAFSCRVSEIQMQPGVDLNYEFPKDTVTLRFSAKL